MKFVKDLFQGAFISKGKNNFFLILFLFSSCATLYTGVSLGAQVLYQLRLNRVSIATNLEMKVKQGGNDQFLIEAKYSFNDEKGQEHVAQSLLENRYPNRFLAQRQVQEMLLYDWKVFFNKRYPDLNSLQKVFPFKKLFHFLISLGVLLYFFFLRQMMQRFSTGNVLSPNQKKLP